MQCEPCFALFHLRQAARARYGPGTFRQLVASFLLAEPFPVHLLARPPPGSVVQSGNTAASRTHQQIPFRYPGRDVSAG